jgi:hypothetical protein
VSADLDQLFATARADAEHVPLAAPGQLRQAGDRRTRRTRLATVTVVAAVVGLGVVGLGATFIRHGSTPSPVSSAPVSAPVSSSPVLPSSPAPSSGGLGGLGTAAPSSPPARAVGAACRASDLKVESITSGGASGSTGYTVTVTNRSATMCKLSGTPALKWIKSNDATATIPTSDPGPNEPVALQPGKLAEFIIVITNGFGGYDPSSPACANSITYKRISAVVGGERLALTGLVLDVRCDGVRETAWATVAG